MQKEVTNLMFESSQFQAKLFENGNKLSRYNNIEATCCKRLNCAKIKTAYNFYLIFR